MHLDSRVWILDVVHSLEWSHMENLELFQYKVQIVNSIELSSDAKRSNENRALVIRARNCKQRVR